MEPACDVPGHKEALCRSLPVYVSAEDNTVYAEISRVYLELYTNMKDPDTEKQIERALKEHGIFWDKSEVWIESESLYEVLYSFETEVK